VGKPADWAVHSSLSLFKSVGFRPLADPMKEAPFERQNPVHLKSGHTVHCFSCTLSFGNVPWNSTIAIRLGTHLSVTGKCIDQNRLTSIFPLAAFRVRAAEILFMEFQMKSNSR
jgi:hypothetical protein